MHSEPALSVVVTTYNKPRDLERVLEGFRGQRFAGGFEVLVCDDGSGPETAELVARFAASAPFPVEHVWQEDAGFRAARSRNNGGRTARGETLVFVDGDCVPWPDFLEVHAAAQAPDRFLAGERYLLEPEEADAVTVAAIASGEAFGRAPKREVRRVGSLAWKNALYRWTGLKPDRPRLMTSNCSVPRAAFEAVNGLDERYEGWGQEDEDLRRRLVARGYRPGSVIGRANCLHLWHAADPTFHGKRKNSPNWRYYQRGFQLSRCRRGLVERPLADVASRVVATDADAAGRAREALGLGPGPTAGAPLEVEVLLDPGPPAPPPRASGAAEVTVLVAAGPPEPGRAAGAQLVLAPGLEVAGGELPGEEHPEVPPHLAGAGVRALRPLPGPPGDPEALAAAAGALERLL